jgi:phage tail-like protein
MRRSGIERLLPAAYQQAAGPGSVLAALLEVMEGLLEPSEKVLDSVADLFAPYRTRDDFVPFLLGWVAADHLAPWGRASAGAAPAVPVGRLRNLLAEGAATARWRGTATGLRAVLEAATGVSGFTVEEPPDRPFHIVVRTPAVALPQLDLVRHITEVEKPAAVTCEVVVDASDQPQNERGPAPPIIVPAEVVDAGSQSELAERGQS